MAFYAYCLLRLSSDEPWPVMQGISEHPVFPFRCGKYTMLLSRLDRNFPFTPRSIVEHAQVISRVFESHTVLPMRFATFFKSEKQISNLIQENQKELLESFCRLRGKAEMRLKLVFQNCHDTKPEWKPLQSIQTAEHESSEEPAILDPARREMADQIATRLRDMFHPLDQQVSCRLIQNRELLVDCAHLIETQKAEIYQKMQPAACEEVKGCDIRISGPWPPYHFLPTSVRLPAATPIPLRRRAVASAR